MACRCAESIMFPYCARKRRTAVLVDRLFGFSWWPETGSNRRRRPFQGRALPLSYLANSRMGARWVALHSSVGMPFHLPLSLRGGARCVLGRISERDNCVSIPSARPAFILHSGSPVQRHLPSNITVSRRKIDCEFAIRGDGSALGTQPPALLSLPQKERLSAVALGLQEQRQ